MSRSSNNSYINNKFLTKPCFIVVTPSNNITLQPNLCFMWFFFNILVNMSESEVIFRLNTLKSYGWCYITLFSKHWNSICFRHRVVTDFTNSLINLQRQPVSHAIYLLWRPSANNLNILTLLDIGMLNGHNVVHCWYVTILFVLATAKLQTNFVKCIMYNAWFLRRLLTSEYIIPHLVCSLLLTNKLRF